MAGFTNQSWKWKILEGLFDKGDNLSFNIVRMPDESSNLPSNRISSATGAETLHTEKVSNEASSFYSFVKPL